MGMTISLHIEAVFVKHCGPIALITAKSATGGMSGSRLLTGRMDREPTIRAGMVDVKVGLCRVAPDRIPKALWVRNRQAPLGSTPSRSTILRRLQ